MPEIQPFRGVRYSAVGELSRLLAPPYDVITPAEQAAFYERDPRNVVRTILSRGPEDAAYAEAGDVYRRWLAEGVLRPDPEPSLYVLEQRFEAEGTKLVRRGLIARFRAEDVGRGTVLPHEQTRAAAKEDRFRLLKSVRANFSPILLMFGDPQGRFAGEAGAIAAASATARYVDDAGVEQLLFRVTEPDVVRRFQELLAKATAYIADGHHRYATALRYRDEVGPEGAWTAGYFTPLEAPGLRVLPYHRVLASALKVADVERMLGRWFRFRPAAGLSAVAREVAQSKATHAFGLATGDGVTVLAETSGEVGPALPAEASPTLRVLDTFFLHQAVLPALGVAAEAVSFPHSLAEVEVALRSGGDRLAVIVRPTPIAQIVAVADARESMPPKSTFFDPKLPSGLVIHPLVV